MTVSGTIFLIIILLVAAGVVWVNVRSKQVSAQKDRADNVIAAVATPPGHLRLTKTELIDGYFEGAARWPIKGAHATVEDSGTVNRRLTATRMATLGPLALAAPKKIDDREVYLLIEGPGVSVLKSVPLKNHPNAGTAIRTFAMKVNSAARALDPQA